MLQAGMSALIEEWMIDVEKTERVLRLTVQAFHLYVDCRVLLSNFARALDCTL